MSPPDRRTSPVGNQLLEIVRTQPGIHFRALERAAELHSAGQLRHHVDRLLHKGALIEVPDGGYTRYFVANEHDRRLRPRLARFARPIPRRIGILLLEQSLNRTELRHRLRCADSTLGYYLKRMEKEGDIIKCKGRTCCHYRLADADILREVFKVPRPVLGALEPATGPRATQTPPRKSDAQPTPTTPTTPNPPPTQPPRGTPWNRPAPTRRSVTNQELVSR